MKTDEQIKLSAEYHDKLGKKSTLLNGKIVEDIEIKELDEGGISIVSKFNAEGL